MAPTRWGDEADDSDDEPQITSKDDKGGDESTLVIPPTHKSRIDKGIQIVTSYRAHPTNPNQLLKTTTKVRVSYVKVKTHEDIEKRKKWSKFGQAALDEDTSNVTIQSRDDVFMEDPHADTDLQDEDPANALAGNLNAFWAKQQRRQLERKYDVDVDAEGAPAAAAGGADGWTQVGAAGAGAAPGKYVPPAARAGLMGKGGGGAGMPERRNDDLNTIRVTNISENTTEADLQDLFQPFGRISRVYLAKDKETMISRGFAFVSFVHREDAARAMEKLQGHGYDHLILKLEWARPSAPKDPAAATEYRSGYGKALAQDTKEKVSYASNLTRGV
mmetsp:Transcript_13996/g.15371  ORF Transcript_13996/g.15371 Transcript_13996/m.15371 type:complete len:331 (-) Transcript_13996:58-1050(-)